MLAVVFFPWSTARFLLKPAIGPQPRDRLLDRIGFWRAVIGLAAVAVASTPYLSVRAVLGNAQEKALLTAQYAMIGLPLAFFVLLAATRSAYRHEFVGRTPRLVRRVATVIACYGVLFGYAFAVMGFFSLFNGELRGVQALLALASLPGLILTGLWCAVFFACTIYWAARTSFWLGEMHPLLAPVGSVVLVLVVTARETYLRETNGLPSPLWLSLNICGLISTLALAFWEYRHLRASGYRFREGPNPTYRPPVATSR
ncbi:hypothetical protein [Saccharopolyspora taberi]|uniref:Uncharacterized protein n=1 Tax=Saccharopolyspora taberi TaxID=60895 RepID=A0ABN3VD47_9PSEU